MAFTLKETNQCSNFLLSQKIKSLYQKWCLPTSVSAPLEKNLIPLFYQSRMASGLYLYLLISFSTNTMTQMLILKISGKLHLMCHHLSETKYKSMFWEVSFLISYLNLWKMHGGTSQPLSTNIFFSLSPEFNLARQNLW